MSWSCAGNRQRQQFKKKKTYIKIYIILEFGKCGLGFQEAIAGSPNNSGHSQGLAGLNSESSFALVDVHSGSINPPSFPTSSAQRVWIAYFPFAPALMLPFDFTSSVLNLLRQLQFQGSLQGCAGAELQGVGSSTSLVASPSKITTRKIRRTLAKHSQSALQ